MSYTPPPLMLAARQKLMASPAFQALVSDGTVGKDDQFSTGWVFFGTMSNGFPYQYGDAMAAVTIGLRGSWAAPSRSNNLHFPVLKFAVFGDGDPDIGDGEWQARAVGQAIIDEFHDPANSHNHQWAREVYAISCIWEGNLSCAEVQGVPGLFRADVYFDLEVG
jgi:hypothetical protein